MAFPQIVLDNLDLAIVKFRELDGEDNQNILNGCSTCEVKDYPCLFKLIRDLQYKIELDQFDTVAIGLYNKMMEIIGGSPYTQVGPLVSAGPDKSAFVNVPQTVNAIITQGYYPIVSILWEQTFGPTAGISGQNTATLQINTFGVGYSVFKVTVEDSMGNINSDSMELEGLSIQATIGFGYSATDPYGSENVPTLQFSKDIDLGATEYILNFTNAANLQYLIIKEPIGEPVKTVWINTEELNEGEIPDSKMRNPVTIGSFRYYISRVPFALDTETQTITFKTTI